MSFEVLSSSDRDGRGSFLEDESELGGVLSAPTQALRFSAAREASLQRHLQQFKKDYQELDRQYQTKSQKCNDLRTKLKECKAALSARSRELEVATKMLQKVADEKKHLQDAHAEDKVALRKLEARMLDAKDHTALAETAAGAKRQVKLMQTRLMELEAELAAVHEVEQQKDREIDRLQRAMDMCVKDLSNGKGQDIQSGLIMALAESRQEALDLAKQLAAEKSQQAKLRASAARMQEKLEAAELQRADAEVAVEQLQQRLEKLLDTTQEAAADRAELACALTELREEAGEVRVQREELAETLLETQEQQQADAEHWEQENRNLQQSLELAQAELRHHQEQSERLLSEVRSSAASRQADLESRVAELREEVQELTTQLAQERQAQQSTAASKQGKMLVLERQAQQARDREVKLLQSLAAIQARMTSLEQQLKEHKVTEEQLEEFKKKASKSHAEACVFRQERDALAARLTALGQDLEEERDAADQQLEDLQQQLAAKEAALRLASEAAEDMQDQLEQQRQLACQLSRSKAKLQESMLQQITDVKSKLQQAELRSSLDIQPLADGWLWSSPEKKATGGSTKRPVGRSTGGRSRGEGSTSRSPRKSPLRGTGAFGSSSIGSWPDTAAGTGASVRSPLRRGVACPYGAGGGDGVRALARGSIGRTLGSMMPEVCAGGEDLYHAGSGKTGRLAAAVQRGLVDCRMPFATSAVAAIEAGELLQLRASVAWRGEDGKASGALRSSCSPQKRQGSRRQQQQYMQGKSIDRELDMGDDGCMHSHRSASAESPQRSSMCITPPFSQELEGETINLQQQADEWQRAPWETKLRQQQGQLGSKAAGISSSSHHNTHVEDCYGQDLSFSGLVRPTSPPSQAQSGTRHAGALAESLLDPYSPSLLSAKKGARKGEGSSSSAGFSRLGPLNLESQTWQRQQQQGPGQPLATGVPPAAAAAAVSPSSHKGGGMGGTRPGPTDLSEPYSLPMSAECSQLSGLSTAAAAAKVDGSAWPQWQQRQLAEGNHAAAAGSSSVGGGSGGGDAAGTTGGNPVLASARETLQRIKAKRSQLSRNGRGLGGGDGGSTGQSTAAGSLQTSRCTSPTGAAAANGCKPIPSQGRERAPAILSAARGGARRSSSSGSLSDSSRENNGRSVRNFASTVGGVQAVYDSQKEQQQQHQQQGMLGSAKLVAKLQQLQQQKRKLEEGRTSRSNSAAAGGSSSNRSPRPEVGSSSPDSKSPSAGGGKLSVAAAGPILLSPPSTTKAQRSRPAWQPDGQPIPLVGLEEAGKKQQQSRDKTRPIAAEHKEKYRSGTRQEQLHGVATNHAGGVGTSIQAQLDMGMEQFISKLADGELTLEELAGLG